MSGGNDGNGSSWGSRFLKVAGAAAATAAVAAGVISLLSSPAAAEAPFAAPRDGPQAHPDDHNTPNNSSDPEELTERWKKPEIGWVKVNVDGGRDHDEPSAGSGGVVRDEHGEWLLGFARKLDPNINNAHETELEAILTGLELAWKRNYEKVVVESDCEPALSMVKKGLVHKLQRREHEVVECIRKLLFAPKWQVKLVYVDRSANRVANRLSKVARQLPSLQLIVYPSPPDPICNKFILEDKNNDNGHVYAGYF
ncbi:hypothetical protein Fmac_003110 [Flemingia macrophylla]|uniref:RNase H type-1 domain-containing protein n=1 Tax=Flemingia macrophylla TaxID=520843 RepID=A0ABD1NLU3_9FABA